MVEGTNNLYTLLIFSFSLVFWYFGIYKIIEEETENSIKRINELLKLLEDAKIIDNVEKKCKIYKAVEANEVPLKMFKSLPIRFILLWSPSLVTTISLLGAVTLLAAYNFTSSILYLNYIAKLINYSIIVLGVILFISAILVAIAFRKHPEKEFIDCYLEFVLESKKPF